MNYAIQYNLSTGYTGRFDVESSPNVDFEILANGLIIGKEKSNLDAGETLTAEVIVYDESGGEQHRYATVIVSAPKAHRRRLGYEQGRYYCSMPGGIGFYL